MHEAEIARAESANKDIEIARLLIALRGYEVEPVSPFPLLHGDEILRVLHPERRRGYR